MELLFSIVFGYFALAVTDTYGVEVATVLPAKVELALNETRRILKGKEVTDSMPYMVYLKLPSHNKKHKNYRTWLCGGIIVHEEYILTSAACIEDAEHFYIVSGTYKYSDDDGPTNNQCIENGRKKAVWKCVPKNYVFDGHENDNLRWLNNDIAVVRVEDAFNFEHKVKGCDFIPKSIQFNNKSAQLEEAGNTGAIAGWGSTTAYRDWINSRRKENSQNLMEAEIEIIDKDKCKKRWGERYHNIIDNYMICSKDVSTEMSEICNEKYVDCKDIDYDGEETRRQGNETIVVDDKDNKVVIHSAYHNQSTDSRRAMGGFCENDHGGPLIHGHGSNAVAIGIISACMVKEKSNKCFGPFLYTSIFKNRQFISCAIFKDIEARCRRQFRSGIDHVESQISWRSHPDGPAKNEMRGRSKNRHHYRSRDYNEEEDKVYSSGGAVVRDDREYLRTGNDNDRTALDNKKGEEILKSDDDKDEHPNNNQDKRDEKYNKTDGKTDYPATEQAVTVKVEVLKA